MKKLKILLLYTRPVTSNAQTILDHAFSLKRYSRHDVINISLMYPFGSLPALLDLAAFDVVVVHYTIPAKMDKYLNPRSRAAIGRFDGLKVQFIQDEYRHVDATVEACRQLGTDVLFTCVPEPEVEKVYSPAALPRTRKVTVLTGYVPEELTRLRVPPIAQRPLDVGYRARKPAYWYGALGVEKWHIGEGFLAATRGSGLACDIASGEASRLYGRKWTRFLTSCKTVLGVESGASVFDFTGEIQHSVEAYVKAHPEAGFEEVRDRYFAQEEGKIRLNQISPRCFEAAALRTGMVLFEGEYSGILAPGRHYLPLRKDFGNIDAVVEALRDPARLQETVDRTFEEIARNPAYSYAAFVQSFDDIVEEEHERRIGARRAAGRKPAGRLRSGVIVPLYVFLVRAVHVAVYCVRYLLLAPLFRVWVRLPESWKQQLRPFVGAQKN